jgi:hypothetical protein
MLFTLTSKIRNIILLFKNRIFSDLGRFEAEDCLYTQLNDLEYKGLLDSASLVITPNGYEETKLFSVVPNDGTTDLTFTRATTGTRINSEGLIEQVPYNKYLDNSIFHFRWEQARPKYYNINPSTKQILNHLPNHEAISDKGNLHENLKIYCEKYEEYMYRMVPVSFILDFANSESIEF